MKTSVLKHMICGLLYVSIFYIFCLFAQDEMQYAYAYGNMLYTECTTTSELIFIMDETIADQYLSDAWDGAVYADSMAPADNAESIAIEDNAKSMALVENADLMALTDNADLIAPADNAESIAPADNMDSMALADNAATVGELQAWFDAHLTIGGVVALTGDIWLNEGDSLYADRSYFAPSIDIEMGNHHIYINGGELFLSESIFIYGEGAGAPMIEEVAKGRVTLIDARIQAGGYGYGGDIAGCCALSLFHGAVIERCVIIVNGDYSLGLKIKSDGAPEEQRAEISGYRVTAYGDYSIAIQCELPLYAEYCDIMAYGIDACAVNAPDFRYVDCDLYPIPAPADNNASNAAEFKAWLEYYKFIGGELTLTDDIWFDEGFSIDADIGAPVRIMALDHSIYVNGGSVYLRGTLIIEGEAGRASLIDDVYGGDLFLGNGVRVIAHNRSAVRSNSVAGFNGCQISAYGDNVPAFYIEGAATDNDFIELFAMKITVDGENSTAVYCDAPLIATLCVIEADGTEAQSIVAPSIMLRNSKVNPQPASYNVDDALPAPYGMLNYLEAPVGYPVERIVLPDIFFCDILGFLFYYDVQWDLSGVDMSVEGIGTITGVAGQSPLYYPSFISDIGLVVEPVFTIKFSNPRKPEFSDDMYYLIWTRTLSLYLKDEIDPGAAELFMWDDECNQWNNITARGQVSIYEDAVYISSLPDNASYGFKLNVSGDGLIQGESDSIWVDINNGVAAPDTGGDRTGTDRGGEDIPAGSDNQSDNNQSGDDRDNDSQDGDDQGNGNQGGGNQDGGNHDSDDRDNDSPDGDNQDNDNLENDDLYNDDRDNGSQSSDEQDGYDRDVGGQDDSGNEAQINKDHISGVGDSNQSVTTTEIGEADTLSNTSISIFLDNDQAVFSQSDNTENTRNDTDANDDTSMNDTIGAMRKNTIKNTQINDDDIPRGNAADTKLDDTAKTTQTGIEAEALAKIETETGTKAQAQAQTQAQAETGAKTQAETNVNNTIDAVGINATGNRLTDVKPGSDNKSETYSNSGADVDIKNIAETARNSGIPAGAVGSMEIDGGQTAPPSVIDTKIAIIYTLCAVVALGAALFYLKYRMAKL